MRKWVAASVILFVLVAFAGVALVNLNGLINRHKGYLLDRAQEALGRNVTVEEIGITLWGGIGVRLKQFSLADDPSFSKDAFVRAADLQVNMKFLPLLRKELQVSKVILHRPVINVIRDQNGQFNFSTIGGETRQKDLDKQKEKQGRPEERGAPPFAVPLVDIDGGDIHYTDDARGIDFRAAQLDFKIKDITSSRPVEVDLEAAVLGAAKQNLKVKGHVGPLANKADLNHVPVDGDLELDSVPFANLEKTLPGFTRRLPKGLDLSGSIGVKTHFSGSLGKAMPDINGTLNLIGVNARMPELAQPITDVNAKINFTGKDAELPESAFRLGHSQIRAAAKVISFEPLNFSYRLTSPELNLADLKATAPGRKKTEILKEFKGDGTVSIKDGAVTSRGDFSSPSGTIADGDYRDLKVSASFADRVATIESVSLGAFAGSLQAKGRYDIRESTPRFAATATIKGMDLTQIFRAFVPSAPQNIRGLITMDLDVTGSGREWNVIQNTLKGQGRAEVANGALLDVNLAEGVMSNSGIPGAINLLPADIRKKYPAIFSAKDTEFKQMKGSAIIGDGRARTEDLVVSAAEFETQGKGWFAFDRTVDFRAQLLISQQLSQDIISRAREAKNLADDQGRITIPFTLSGKLPKAKPKPDMGYIARAMQKGFFGSFTRKKPSQEDSQNSSDEPADSGSQKKKKKSPQDEILRGLQQFFGK